MSGALEQELARQARGDLVFMAVIAAVSFVLGAGGALLIGALA